MIRRLLFILFVIHVFLAPAAIAGPDGTVPSPGLCDYPGVGVSFQVMNVWHYNCDFPTEINGSHWHCELDGVDLQGAVTAGISISMFSLAGTLSGQIGGIFGSCSWRCPDLTLARQPNPPGAWKSYLAPVECKSVGPAPPRAGDEAADRAPPPANGPVSAAQGLLAPPPVPPANTNPVPGNPLQQDNQPK